ncbi:MAG TPA: D-alanyl-D-alanine carboxypeptidase/D-alanyl-D-alanine-endopeptidase, partial [Verrucomicrobiales bacterium]|nr:D-alanyl-D-alanine carboxypeptidase/D-alanyl-D-alanine-endopeptidase [Verrucomicrobiales bacterium]
ASNTKLFTAAMALEVLGPAYRIRTTLLSSAKPDSHGRLNGDLVVRGEGDPSFSSRFPGREGQPPLEPLVGAMQRAGVRSVRGNLIADESAFVGPPFGAGWMAEDLDAPYSPEISPLSLNENVAEWVITPGPGAGTSPTIRVPFLPSAIGFANIARTALPGTKTDIQSQRLPGQSLIRIWGEIAADSPPITNLVAVHRPAEWFGTALADAAGQRGIRITGQVRAVDWFERRAHPEGVPTLKELAHVDSPPVSEIVRAMLKPSNNQIAEMLLLVAGTREPGGPVGQTTEARGAAALARFYKSIPSAPPEPYLEEGSGLSRRHEVSAASLVALLAHMDRHPAGAAFREALPVAGVDGTLATRMRGTAAQNTVRAKTGTLHGVNSLSGYVTTAAGERLAFAILLNGYSSPDPQHPARGELDAIAVALAGLQTRSR